MKFRFAPLLSLWFLLVPMPQRQAGNFLDLTKVKSPRDEKLIARGGGGVSGSHDTRFPKLSLKITLLSIDKRSLQMEEEMIYEVAIRNIGHDTVVIPWSPYQGQLRPNESAYPPGYIDAKLGLVFSDKILGEQIIFGPWLYGSDREPSTVRKLRPRQTVRIRAPVRWQIMSADVSQDILSRLPQKYIVRARLILSRHAFSPQPEPVVSANSVTVELKKQNQ